MCGIVGIVGNTPEMEITSQQVVEMRDILTHRGPDDAGVYLTAGAGFGARRLAILDLSPRGHMPMGSQDGRYWIVYNGEIYNFQELRRELESRGVRFRSQTDTEVLLELYMQDGEKMLDRLNGMFAFAIWDEQERALFLARDRLGVKPLFYASNNHKFYFASEIKALFAAGIEPEFDHSCWEELLCFRFIAGERTVYQGVQRLLPGHCLTLRDGAMRIRRWWNLSERILDRRTALPADLHEWYRAVFDDSIRLRRISDVPVGVLLSGGLDSSSVAASLAMQAASGTNAFTVRFTDNGYDEGPVARSVVDRYRLAGNELFVPSGDLIDILRQAAWHADEPLVHSSDTHLLAIARCAKPRVTVLLNGEGADETLGGYVRYQPLRFPALLALGRTAIAQTMLSNSRGRVAKLEHLLRLGDNSRLVLYNACDVLPDDLRRVGLNPIGQFVYREAVLAEAQSVYPRDLARQAMYSDQLTFLCSVLDRNDRMTMAASTECREPFMDYRLVETVAAMPGRVLFSGLQTKPLLRKCMYQRLPDAVKQHRKWGFGVPWKRYYREIPVLREQFERIGESSLLQNAPLDQGSVRQITQQFLNGDDRMFSLAHQIFITAFSWNCIQQGLSAYRRQPALSETMG